MSCIKITLSRAIAEASCDGIMLLNHHAILETDSDPLFNAKIVVEFVRDHYKEYVFCGHRHQLSVMKSTDLYYKHSFTQYKIGSLSSDNTPNDTNMFMYCEGFDSEEMKIHAIRAVFENESLKVKEEIIVAN